MDGHYSGCQNKVPFQPPDNLVSAGKNSQIKARKSKQGSDVKITLQKCDFYIIWTFSMLFALTRSNLLRQLPDRN